MPKTVYKRATELGRRVAAKLEDSAVDERKTRGQTARYRLELDAADLLRAFAAERDRHHPTN
jgi:hypothetical protein